MVQIHGLTKGFIKEYFSLLYPYKGHNMNNEQYRLHNMFGQAKPTGEQVLNFDVQFV